jgi:ABC-type amino acid transport substrate-binding protein
LAIATRKDDRNIKNFDDLTNKKIAVQLGTTGAKQKDTSLVAVIGFEELFRQGQLLVATTYRAFEIYAAVALVYLVLTSVSATGFRWLEDLMNPLRKTKKARS